MNDRINYLVEKLNYYTRYYDDGNSLISDKEWDDMYFELVELERNTGYIHKDSPTQKITYEIVNELNKVEHNHKMLSLEKTKDVSFVKSFFGKHDFIAMGKMDGLTCSLRYVDGYLVSAETRGNGIIGEDILHNAKVIPSIPNRINYTDELIIDGEIVCTYDNFEIFKGEYKNPRNFASGSIRLLDSNECAKRKLTFITWDVIKGFDEINSLCRKLEVLFDDYGFEITPTLHSQDRMTDMTEDIYKDHLDDMINDIIEQSRINEYPIDGIVFKYDDIEYGKSLGETAHHFKNAIAYKFYDETYSTTLLDIEWTMGRTGVLTPVAIFEPVEIDGTTVERANLHNINIMDELLGEYPHVGQVVEVYKANMIIPQIQNADKEIKEDSYYNNHEIFDIPNLCPVCGGRTEIVETQGTTVLKCDSSSCSGKLINKLENFCGKKGLDIKGLSKATLEKLINWGWVNSFSDIFELHSKRAEWIQVSGFGPKSVDNILKAIENSKSTTLNKFIAALGIPLIGVTAAKELSKHFASWSDFYDQINNNYAFYELPTFGPEMHAALMNYDFTEANDLYNNYLNISSLSNNNNNNTLEGLVFVITGKLETISRADLQTKIEALGGRVSGSVSSKTTCLINNDVESNSSKNKTAKQLEIPIITELEFFKKYLKL